MKKTRPTQQGFAHILLIVLVVIVLGGTSFVVYRAHNKQVNQTRTTSETTDETADPAQIIKKIAAEVPKKFASLSVKDDTAGNHGSAVYSVRGYDYLAVGKGSENTSTQFDTKDVRDNGLDKSTEAAARDFIAGLFADHGLSKDIKPPASNDEISIDYYVGKNLVCTIQTSLHPAVIVNCVTTEQLEKTAELAAPFAASYKESDPEKIELSDYAFGTPTITASHTPGYRTASVGIGRAVGPGGAIGIFYEKDQKWHYLTSSQQIVACAEFESNPDARLAFLGHSCYDETNNNVERTVR